NVFTEAMEVFHAAADLVGLDPRVRLELEEPDYEHIFYVTAVLNDRLTPLDAKEEARYSKLNPSSLRPDAMIPLANGKFILRPDGLRGADLHVENGVIRLPSGLYRMEEGQSRRFKSYRIQ